MDYHQHLDMEADVQSLIRKREGSLAHRAICDGDRGAAAELLEVNILHAIDSMKKCALENRHAPEQRQVESTLQIPTSREVQRQLEDAEADNVVYEALGKHAILGKKKKKKKRSIY